MTVTYCRFSLRLRRDFLRVRIPGSYQTQARCDAGDRVLVSIVAFLYGGGCTTGNRGGQWPPNGSVLPVLAVHRQAKRLLGEQDTALPDVVGTSHVQSIASFVSKSKLSELPHKKSTLRIYVAS